MLISELGRKITAAKIGAITFGLAALCGPALIGINHCQKIKDAKKEAEKEQKMKVKCDSIENVVRNEAKIISYEEALKFKSVQEQGIRFTKKASNVIKFV